MNKPMLTLEELLDDDGIIAECSRIASRRRLQVVKFGFGQAKIGISMEQPLQDVGVYADAWDFPTPKAALLALATWNPEESAEPTGWHRHVATGRFRIKGDAHLEYVKDAVGDSIEKQIAYAVKVTQGEEYEVREVEEDPKPSPEGFRYFRVVTECQGQQCDFGMFYYYGRYAVISPYGSWVDAANIKQRLTDPWPS